MFELSKKAQDFAERTRKFILEEIEPVEAKFWEEVHELNPDGNWKKWQWPELLETLKSKAKQAGLWNMFLPDEKLGAGLTVQEYAHIAELTGRSLLAPTVFNCNAPDTGNMELLWRYGSEQQKQQWLQPLLDGKIRSVFCMTEPDVASSDATNMQATALIDGNEIVLNGKKWWSSGLGDPNAKVIIFMAHTPDETKDRHHQHSMVLVPIDTVGVEIQRMLPVFGDYDAPHGHGEVHFNNVRVPIENFIGGAGQGFEIAQGRLGPGRIHHCMRCIGAAEKALELMIDRGMSRTAFGKEILKLGGNLERVADARVAIDQARLLTLYAAYKMDTLGNMAALTEISAIKVVAPSVLEKVVDMAIQLHGGAGLSRDTPLTGFFAQARSLRLADGPDEVHKGMIAKLELAKRGYFGRHKKV
ncbi:acyl-CoA dehydrogenase family protein [Acinetobacter oleivorans]|uniref:acyl-CoA dehydrogenase family protein n=1 Tax=Acinetobacter oleivorans TaxID=1148157 RepID=UPI00178C8E0C|nr:acyl-CoA dehydrogenase family protein [Acinetobacter oleivorans]MBE2170901.1 acyl-CoA dehydrogenase family protein [Acinetobacter oleivorans]MDY7371918.1 acyl-CoA dehydrogenase family protein [Acinetobacter oleivorans]